MSGPCIYVGVTLPCLLHLYLSLLLCYGSLVPKVPLPKNYVEAKTVSFLLPGHMFLTSPLTPCLYHRLLSYTVFFCHWVMACHCFGYRNRKHT
ncbi:hypothetical protein GE09DRAFT_1094372 [Coniochaeta sp. 2T2.1]|nr:hypothetical protein GE09DRAFT_1094372 [Coniochaeta sp. 2T2.1]